MEALTGAETRPGTRGLVKQSTRLPDAIHPSCRHRPVAYSDDAISILTEQHISGTIDKPSQFSPIEQDDGVEDSHHGVEKRTDAVRYPARGTEHGCARDDPAEVGDCCHHIQSAPPPFMRQGEERYARCAVSLLNRAKMATTRSEYRPAGNQKVWPKIRHNTSAAPDAAVVLLSCTPQLHRYTSALPFV